MKDQFEQQPDSSVLRGPLMVIRVGDVAKAPAAHARLLARLGGTLKVAREQRKLSQLQLSEASGVARSTIQAIENGTSDLRVSQLASLAKILEVPAHWVLRVAM